MTERDPGAGRPLEETSELAAAVDDETTVPQLITDGEPGPDNPPFRDPDDISDGPHPDADVIGAPMGGGTAGSDRRTGSEQPWDPEDLAAGRGLDPTPENAERARRELAEDGPAAIEKTVP